MLRHLGSLVLAAVLLLTTAACSDDPPEEPDPTTSPSSDGSLSTPEPTATPTTEPPTPTETPAVGLRMRQGRLSVHAPEGWAKSPEPELGEFSEQAVDQALGSTLYIAELPDTAPGAAVDLDQLARSAIRNANYVRDPEIVAPVELGGVRWYHTSGLIDPASYEDAFGTVADGFFYRITLTTLKDILPPAEREALLASILDTVELGVD